MLRLPDSALTLHPSVLFEVCLMLWSLHFCKVFADDFILNAPQRQVEVLSSIPKCLKEQMHMRYKFCSD